MKSAIKVIKSKLKIEGLDREDANNLDRDIGYLVYVMSSGENMDDFIKLLKQAKLNPKGPAGQKKPASFEDKTTFHTLLKSHRDFLADIKEAPIERFLHDDQLGPRLEKMRFSLKQFHLPKEINNSMDLDLVSIYDLESPLSGVNYRRKFQSLLWIEEAHHAITLRRYDLKCVMIEKYLRDCYKLSVPGLAEGRPSLMVGDKLMLQIVGQKFFCEGYIMDVRQKDILINLHGGIFEKVYKFKFNVFFLATRTSFRRCHHAVVNFKKMNILFPDKKEAMTTSSKGKGQIREGSLRWFSKDLNVYQKRTVINVLEAKCRPAPYIIFGPPGTGKTVTMVEAILQVYNRKRDGKILVCGNSNSCADSLAARIKESGVVELEKMVRISAFNRLKKKLVPTNILDITSVQGQITQKAYRKIRIVITTCTQSCVLNEYTDKFDYVFIDEAGHASEPEALISIGLMKPNGCVVLAGDPHQLGPVCMSLTSKNYGLGTSLLERLCGLPVYQRHGPDMVYDERYLSKLMISYRSDARVMSVNNDIFYDNDLTFVNRTPQKWLDLFQITSPLVFHRINGRDRRDIANPSWFNANEAILSLCYAKLLYANGLRPEQLGIITPYRSQIEKLNILFDMCQLDKCKIASMEEFQGDEREVIIISTVRATAKNIKFDQKFNLGFLFSPKRFNVAISRAKWLVIVLGDPEILSRDNFWKKYIRTAQEVALRKC